MKVVLLTARDPLRGADGATPPTVASHLVAEGHEVTLVLLEEAVGLARNGHAGAAALTAAISAGVEVLADAEALARRAVDRVGEGIKPTDLGDVVDLLLERSDRQVWL